MHMHHGALHGAGVAQGLEGQSGSEEKSKWIQVGPGVAIAPHGELIALSESGKANISLIAPGERERQISSPFRLDTAEQSGKVCYLTIQHNLATPVFRSNAGKVVQRPWLRLQPVSGDSAFADAETAIILAVVTIDVDGNATVIGGDEILPYQRQLMGSHMGELSIRQFNPSGNGVAETRTAKLGPNTNGGLQLTVADINSDIRLAPEGCGNFANLDVQGNNTRLHGALRVDGITALMDDMVGIGPETLDRALTIQKSGNAFLNVKANEGSHEVLVGADNSGGIVSTMTNHDLHLHAGGNSTKVTVKASGNVGIGTVTPTARLEVGGWRYEVVARRSHQRIFQRYQTIGQ